MPFVPVQVRTLTGLVFAVNLPVKAQKKLSLGGSSSAPIPPPKSSRKRSRTSNASPAPAPTSSSRPSNPSSATDKPNTSSKRTKTLRLSSGLVMQLPAPQHESPTAINRRRPHSRGSAGLAQRHTRREHHQHHQHGQLRANVPVYQLDSSKLPWSPTASKGTVATLTLLFVQELGVPVQGSQLVHRGGGEKLHG